jgi:DNA mismatch repair protein MutL
MGIIKKLSLGEAQKIAAGEVVERPANVLKELLENSIDAGATAISVYLEEGGKELIRVVDNGCGMSRDDACMSIVHHATSKISSVDDLMSLTTYGFRGEALSSMSAVSKMTLITKRKEDTIGSLLTIQDGALMGQEDRSCNQGTDITLKELFYAMPARKKFLKTTATEYRNCLQNFHVFALTYPAIRFELYHNGSLVLSCRQETSLLKRAAQILEERTVSSLIPLEVQTDSCSLIGVISNHQHMRYDRAQMITLVNKRWVRNHGLAKAIIKGYNNVLLPGRYPTAIISLTVPSDEIDVNVHPKKEEVQFLHAHTLEKALEKAINQGLTQHQTATTLKAPDKPLWVKQPVQYEQRISLHKIEEEPVQELKQDYAHFQAALNQSFEKPIESPPIPVIAEKKYTLKGQYKLTYILIETDAGLVIIDQHAAHEAVLFEKYSTRFETIATTTLLFPEVIQLSAEDHATALAHQNFFEQQGIVFETFGPTTIRLQATPVHAKKASISELIREMITYIQEHEREEEEELYRLLTRKTQATMACKAAVKAGDVLSFSQMEQIVFDLYATENRLTCPHGRPTSWLFSHYDIEKKFKRV